MIFSFSCYWESLWSLGDTLHEPTRIQSGRRRNSVTFRLQQGLSSILEAPEALFPLYILFFFFKHFKHEPTYQMCAHKNVNWNLSVISIRSSMAKKAKLRFEAPCCTCACNPLHTAMVPQDSFQCGYSSLLHPLLMIWYSKIKAPASLHAAHGVEGVKKNQNRDCSEYRSWMQPCDIVL